MAIRPLYSKSSFFDNTDNSNCDWVFGTYTRTTNATRSTPPPSAAVEEEGKDGEGIFLEVEENE